MNKTYKDSNRLRGLIDIIVSPDNMYKFTPSDLRNRLEAVAELAFLEGQFSMIEEIEADMIANKRIRDRHTSRNNE